MKKVECRACGATGLYRGFAEPKGTAVICLYCKGSAARDADDIPASDHVPFRGRRRREGIRTVMESKGSFILSCGGKKGTDMTYEQFLARFPEGDIWKDSWQR